MPNWLRRIEIAIAKSAIQQLTRTPCPDGISRNSETIDSVDFHSVWIRKPNNRAFLVRSINGEVLSGTWSPGEKMEADEDILLSDLHFEDFKIRHYYRWATIEYDGLVDYLVTGVTRAVHAKYWLWYFQEWMAKAVFNSKRLVAKDRYELLRMLVDRHINMEENEFESLQIMTELYTFRWHGHPEGAAQYRACELHLDSLAESGELKKSNRGTYSVSGAAIKSLREDEYAERRHRDSLSVQRKMLWITVLLVLASVIQAGLIKLGPVVDFTK